MDAIASPAFPAIAAEKRANGLLYGIFAALAFSATAWGYDALELSVASAYLPWIKIAVGGLVTLLICGLAGYLSARLDSGLFSFVIWLVVGVILGWISGHLPFDLTTRAFHIFHPEIAAFVNYPYTDAAQVRTLLNTLTVTLFVAIGGALELPIVDSATAAGNFVQRLLPLSLSILVFGTGGLVGTEIQINKPLSDPLVVMADLVEFRIQNEGRPIDRNLSREIRYAALNPVQDLIRRPYHLLVGDYNDDLSMTGVLIDFDGDWVRCVLITNQPTICKPLESAGTSGPGVTIAWLKNWDRAILTYMPGRASHP